MEAARLLLLSVAWQMLLARQIWSVNSIPHPNRKVPHHTCKPNSLATTFATSLLANKMVSFQIKRSRSSITTSNRPKMLLLRLSWMVLLQSQQSKNLSALQSVKINLMHLLQVLLMLLVLLKEDQVLLQWQVQEQAQQLELQWRLPQSNNSRLWRRTIINLRRNQLPKQF